MSTKADFRLDTPVHPGCFVRTEIIEPFELSVTEAAEVLGISRTALSAFLNERTSLSPDMALRVEKAFGMSMETLMRMQNNFDIAQARKRAGNINVSPFVPRRKVAQQPGAH